MSFADELFESIASELGGYFLETIYLVSLPRLILLSIVLIAIVWQYRPTGYPYDEFPRIRRPIFQFLPWYGKSVADAVKEGWEEVCAESSVSLMFAECHLHKIGIDQLSRSSRKEAMHS